MTLMKNHSFKHLFTFCLAVFGFTLIAKDWPIYKGNVYFTSNNDEIVVKNNRLKWAFVADFPIKNPVVYNDKLLFLDMKKNIYCIDQNSGKLIYKISLSKIASQFRDGARIKGKVKYPIIKNNIMYITDSIAIYAINLSLGKVIWARTALIKSSFGSNYRKRSYKRRYRRNNSFGYNREIKRRYRSRYQRKNSYRVASIYSDPAINNSVIFYGTRKTFLARDINTGKELWRNDSIHSYSGFPSFYDKYILTLSANYLTQEFDIVKIVASTGIEVWRKKITKPFKLFAPLVFKGKVYLGVDKSIFSFDFKTGKKLWQKNYKGIITSNLSFSENEIIFSLNNKKIVSVQLINGDIKHTYEFGDQSSPYFVVTRDQFYTAYEQRKNKVAFTSVQGLGFDKDDLWQFQAICPGAPSQPVSSKGTIFVPAGKILYALGYKGTSKLGELDENSCDSFKEKWKQVEEKKNIYSKLNPHKKKKLYSIEYNLHKFHSSAMKLKTEIYRNDEVIFHSTKTLRKKQGRIYLPQIKNSKTILYFSHNNYLTKKVELKHKKKINVSLEKIEINRVYNAKDIHFATASSHLTNESIPLLDSLVTILKYKKNLTLNVSGFTDNRGSAKFNLKLSSNRAQAVIDYLVKNGISPDRLKAKGLGASKPIASNITKVGRASNRRTEFVFRYR